MALIIETGTGASDAQAWADAAALDAWCDLYYVAAETADTATKEAAILRAVAFMSGLSWYGSKVNGRAQALPWPRSDAVDREGFEIAETEIPAEVIEAQHALARAEVRNPGVLSPDVTLAGRKVLVGLDKLTWKVTGVSGSVDAERAVITLAMDRLKGLIASGRTSFVQRA